MNWKNAALYCRKTFGSHIDWEEEFFECPECGEPIYKVDWEDHDDWNICPICEVEWESIE